MKISTAKIYIRYVPKTMTHEKIRSGSKNIAFLLYMRLKRFHAHAIFDAWQTLMATSTASQKNLVLLLSFIIATITMHHYHLGTNPTGRYFADLDPTTEE